MALKEEEPEVYEKLEQLEHILKRPDTYVGSVEMDEREMWVFDRKKKILEFKSIKFVPGLYKIFDEILVNAADHAIRDHSMDEIRVIINQAEATISIQNNGSGVPIEIHKEHNVYVPELIFGHLLTSDNYDDAEEKVVGGRNGYGAKLTNAFSTKFVLETCDRKRKLVYKQVFSKNMSEKSTPEITKIDSDTQDYDYTRITFTPDLARFKMTELEDDITSLFYKRVYDVAGTTHSRVRVYLNGELLPVVNFTEYVGMYMLERERAAKREAGASEDPDAKPEEVLRAYFSCHRWETVVSISDGAFQQVSFVNSISTNKGGTHVKHIADQLVECIYEKSQKEAMKKGLGKNAVKHNVVKDQLSIYVNCLIVNPTFDSQTKDMLTLKQSSFGSHCSLSDELKQQVLESGIVEMVLEWASISMKQELAKKMEQSAFGCKSRIIVPKLEDANFAGTKRSGECTLILTEGDSAKALAVAGLAVIGRDKYGVFPLRGKPLNVRDCTLARTLQNEEIHNVLKILALDPSKDVDSVEGLRYGNVMIMADQDLDGSHIKGLLINLLQYWFPKLLQCNFIRQFITPIVKVTKKDHEPITFYAVQDYHKWQHETPDSESWDSKYYKGLGTSTAKEAKEYFKELDKHEIKFTYTDEKDDDLVVMAFKPSRADDRKDWIMASDENMTCDTTTGEVTYADFINKELVHFSRYSTHRAVPALMDGLKPGQRKVMFGCFQRNLINDCKVAQLVGDIANRSGYHHGEVSLQMTIIKLAQNFVGAQNVNYLVPSGQFGTRSMGGKDHAAPRYIYTRLSKVARALFRPEDDPLLEYLEEEGQSIEPRWYCPVIPTVLVNGAMGMGTGWSTFLPQYNPRDIVENVRRHIRGQPLINLIPWFRGFKGSVKRIVDESEGDKESYCITGCVSLRTRTMLEITELPAGKWTQDYKEWLQKLLPNTDKKSTDEEKSSDLLTDMREYHTENTVHFVCTITPDKAAKIQRAGLERALRVKSVISCDNMHLFSPGDEKITKYSDWRQIFNVFCVERRKMYEKRKAHMIKELERQLSILSNKVRFITMVIEETLIIEEKKQAELNEELRELGFTPHPTKTGKDFDYLLSQKIWRLTEERIAALKEDAEKARIDLEDMKVQTIDSLWLRDLDDLEKALDAQDKGDLEEQAQADKMNKKTDAVLELSDVPNCIYLNSANQIRRMSSEVVRKVAFTKNKLGRPVGACPEGSTTKLKLFCCANSFDTLLILCTDGFLLAIPSLRIPLSRVRDAKGNHAVETLLPELQGKKIATIINIDDGNAWEDKLIIIATEKGFLSKSKLSVFKKMCDGRAGGRAMKMREDDRVKYCALGNPEDSVMFCTHKGFLAHIPLSLFPTRNRGSSGMRIKIFNRILEDPTEDISMVICPFVEKCKNPKIVPKGEKSKEDRIPSSYFLFLTDLHKANRESGEKGSVSEGGEKWRNLSPEVKAEYEEKVKAMKLERAEKAAKAEETDKTSMRGSEAAASVASDVGEESEAEKETNADEEEEPEEPEEDVKEEEEEAKEGDDDEEEVKEKPTDEPCIVFISRKGKGVRVPVGRYQYQRYTAKGMGGPRLSDPDDAIVSMACVTPDARMSYDAPPKREKTGFHKWYADPENKEAIDKCMGSQPAEIGHMQKLQNLRKTLWDPLAAEEKAKWHVEKTLTTTSNTSSGGRTPFQRWYAQNKADQVEKLAAMDPSLQFMKKLHLLRKEVYDLLPEEERAKYEVKGEAKTEQVPTVKEETVESQAGEDDMEVEPASATGAKTEVEPVSATGAKTEDGETIPGMVKTEPSSQVPEAQIADGRLEELWLATEKDHTHRIKLSTIFLAQVKRPKMDFRKLAKLVPDDKILSASVGYVDPLLIRARNQGSTSTPNTPAKKEATEGDVKMENPLETVEEVDEDKE